MKDYNIGCRRFKCRQSNSGKFVEALMVRKLLLLLVILLISVSAAGCSLFNDNRDGEDLGENIYARPRTLNLDRGKLSELPEYINYSTEAFQIDLRSYDLTALDLKSKHLELMHSDFDNRTKWPYILPKGFDPNKVIEYGKNPGLGIKKLHKAGIDGSGVSAAIIGGPILVDHTEYKKQLKLYKELGFNSVSASIEGTAAASVLAGNSTGVSPGVDLYYVAIKPVNKNEKDSTGEGVKDNEGNSQLSNAIEWIVNFNEKLPAGSKIKVLCIQETITPDDKNCSNILESMKKADDKGIFVISTISHKLYSSEVYFRGLGRGSLSAPDKLSSYMPAKSWANSFYSFGRYLLSSNTLFMPSDSRCTASPTGKKDFTFYSVNDWNLQLPYAAGLYALACQVKPGITPEEFVEKAVKTSDILVKINNLDYKYRLKNVVNPQKLIQAFQNP